MHRSVFFGQIDNLAGPVQFGRSVKKIRVSDRKHEAIDTELHGIHDAEKPSGDRDLVDLADINKEHHRSKDTDDIDELKCQKCLRKIFGSRECIITAASDDNYGDQKYLVDRISFTARDHI